MITVTELERDNASLVEATLSYLMRNEATHCLQIAILRAWSTGSDEVNWWAAQNNGQVVGVATRTPPNNLILSNLVDNDVLPALVKSVNDSYSELPGVIGPKPWSLQFAERWAAQHNQAFELELNEMVYECSNVTFPEHMVGSARFANENDVPWMIPWIQQFHVDANVELIDDDTEQRIRGKLDRGGYVLWLDESGDVVSLAGFGSPTPNGMRVGPVYTPTEHRGNGYGVAVSAAVTQHLLDSGRSFVFLFADLDYPVSNHVYKKIGYQPVAEFGVYRFASAS
jgi:predicted GNAT family acetyltransferase